MAAPFYSQVFNRDGDPYTYLYVGGQWFCFNPNDPPLGEGAMGTVFLGFSCNDNQRIAVKRVREQYANIPAIRERARQEASLSSLSHPNLVKMIGLCEHSDNHGPIFILSGYVSGITLDKHVQTQLSSLTEEERVEKISLEMCNVLDALQYLHSRGVLHRDIKPSNIMIENGKTVKLMDLGIARMNGGNRYSSFGFIGTPQYAAPEQILREKDHAELTQRTDIYSLGVTFYELLTGVNPFLSDIEADVLSRQVTKPLPYNRAIPRQLFKVLRKATEKETQKRFSTASEFRGAIFNALREQDIQLSSFMKLLYALGAFLVVLIVILIFIL